MQIPVRPFLAFVSLFLFSACGAPSDDQHYNNALKFSEENRFHLDQIAREPGLDSPLPESLRAAPARVDWRSLQTGIRNQGDRNTCTAFAKIAAIEARYRRDFGQVLDLSEQYFWHTYKSTGVSFPRYYKYENQSSYWGGGSASEIESAKIYAIPLESDLPYLFQSGMNALRLRIPAAGELIWRPDAADNPTTQAQVDAFEYSPLYVPPHVRQRARYGVKAYTKLGHSQARDTANLENILAAGHEIMLDVNLKWKTNAAGILDWDATKPDAWHAFLVVGYDRASGFFWVKNSWGEGDFLRVTYNYLQNAANSGSYITGVTHPESEVNPKGRMLGFWNMDHDGWKGKLVVRRATDVANNRTRYGHYIDSAGAYKVVNGQSVDNNRGIRFALGSVYENPIGEMSGQVFHVDSYSWTENYAAGFTSWEGTDFGAALTRTSESSSYGNNFTRNKWLGRWAMNHDGWRGTLQIHSFNFVNGRYEISASYRDANNVTKTVTGYLLNGKEHIAKIRIAFAADNNQEFTLHFHSWTANLYSGYTFWSGQRFGVHAFKI